MSLSRGLSAAMLFLILFQSFAFDLHAAAKDERLEVRATATDQLRGLLAGRKVDAVLMDGTRVSGKVKEVRDGSVVMDVDKSDGTAALTLGEQNIATDRFNTLTVTRIKGKKRGIFAAVFGAVGLLAGAALVGMEIDALGGEGSINGTGAAVWTATTVGGAAAGYALGRNMDKKKITVVILK